MGDLFKNEESVLPYTTFTCCCVLICLKKHFFFYFLEEGCHQKLFAWFNNIYTTIKCIKAGMCVSCLFEFNAPNVRPPGRDHKVCGEEGSHPGEQLAVVDHRVPEVLPHDNVRLHHEGTINRRKQPTQDSSSSTSSSPSLDIWDINVRLVTAELEPASWYQSGT